MRIIALIFVVAIAFIVTMLAIGVLYATLIWFNIIMAILANELLKES